MPYNKLFSIFVKDHQDKTWSLRVLPSTCISDIKSRLQELCGVPVDQQYLRSHASADLADHSQLEQLFISRDTTIFLSGKLLGGKGGFGSLLRGSGKTTQIENEDACRDLSGRRIRIVQAEKKLQEWKANEKHRLAQKAAAREQHKQDKANLRAEATQVELEDIRSGQSTALSNVAKAIESGMKSGNKRALKDAAKQSNKKAKFFSDSEHESEDSDTDKDSESNLEDNDNKGTVDSYSIGVVVQEGDAPNLSNVETQATTVAVG